MRVLEILKEEHVTLERTLVALDLAAVGAAHLKPVRPGFFIDTYAFMLNFTEAFHFKKEEEILFKRMQDLGFPEDDGQIGILRGEHQQSHQYIRAMLTAAEQWDAGDLSARSEVIWATSGYTGLLHKHIARENTVFFSLVKQTFSPEELEEVALAFDQFDLQETGEDLHEKYRKLAAALEKEAAAWR